MKQIKLLIYWVVYFSHLLMLYGQVGFEKGFVVQNTGDTLSGYFNYLTDKTLTTKIEYKANLKDGTRELSLNDIELLQFFNGRRFESIVVGKEFSQSKYLSKQLLFGKIDLFTNQTSNNKVRILLRSNEHNKIIELIKPSTREITGPDGRKYKVQTNEFILQMDSLMGIRTDKSIKYTEDFIKNHVRNYNNRNRSEYDSWIYREPRLFTLTFLYGMSIRRYHEVNNPRYSLMFNRQLIDKTRKLSGMIVINYQQTNYFQYSDGDFKIGLMPFGINYSFLDNRVQPYFYTGPIVFYESKTVGIEYTGSSVTRIKGKEVSFGLLAGLGVLFKIDPVAVKLELTPNLKDNESGFYSLGVSYYVLNRFKSSKRLTS